MGSLWDRIVSNRKRRRRAPERPVMIHTSRLRLREVEETDLDAIHAYRRDPDVCRYLGSPEPETREKTWEYVWAAAQQRRLPQRRCYELGIVLADQDLLIGECGLSLLFVSEHSPSPYAATLGFLVHPAHWGNGYATEAASALVRFGLEHLRLETVYAGCLPENVGSRRVLEKAGMVLEGLRSEFPGSPPGTASLAFRIDQAHWRALPHPDLEV